MRNTKRPIQFYRFEFVDLIFELLTNGKPVEATIRGTSMEPTAFDGDKVLVMPITSFECLQEGQIIAFKSEDGRHFVVHRIKKIDKENRTVYELGDNKLAGSYVPFERILGVITKINGKSVD